MKYRSKKSDKKPTIFLVDMTTSPKRSLEVLSSLCVRCCHP